MKDQPNYGAIADAIYQTLMSPNELDSNLEAANMVDGLFFIGRSIKRLAIAVENLREPNDTLLLKGDGDGQGEPNREE